MPWRSLNLRARFYAATIWRGGELGLMNLYGLGALLRLYIIGLVEDPMQRTFTEIW